MERRKFISKGMVAGAILPVAYGAFESPVYASAGPTNGGEINDIDPVQYDDVIIEKYLEGRPHEGKVLAAIQPHCDDISLFAGGTVAKLIQEGYTGYLIRTSNDDAAGAGKTVGERFLNNEKDNEAVAKVLGLKKVYDLGYRNHRMDEYNIQEIKARLIFLFRLLKVDTVITYDPWGHYEENPDHYITAKAVEAARWMAGSSDYPEQNEVVNPHTVTERYYFARGPQLVNRVVDISKFIDTKVKSNIIIKTQGPGGDAGSRLRNTLAAQGKQLAILGNDDATANFSYVKNFVLDMDSKNQRGIASDKEIGKKYGLSWAEQFHYIGGSISATEDYIEKNATSK